jgi:hypothetical protein
MDTIHGSVTGRNPQAGTVRQAYSIQEFCDAHSISRATYYNLRKAGKGPIEMEVNARKLISIESASAWRKQMEAA